MKLHDGIKLTGRVTLLVNGEVVAQSDNLVVTAGKHLIGDMLIDVSGYDTGITYCAVGTGTTAAAAGDTTLETETHREAITSKFRTGLTLVLMTFFVAADINVYLHEVGLFGHSTASGTPDSGVLFARALLDYDNSGGSPTDATFIWEITIA